MTENRGTRSEDSAELIEVLREWQALEDQGIAKLCEIRAHTKNRLLRQVASIIMHDSTQHRRVQAILLHGLTEEPVDVTPEEVDEIWAELEDHDELERAAIEKARQAHAATTDPIVRYFLAYLLADEEKHHRMLELLSEIKQSLPARQGG